MVNPKISVVNGDITKMKSDALVTAINSGGLWFGGIDSAIQRVVGNMYHAQAAAKMPLKNLQTVIAGGNGASRAAFRDVVFVVDDLQSPLNEVVYAGLQASNNEGYKMITVPTIRMGVMNGVVEKTPEEAIAKMTLGVHDFLNDYARKTSLENLNFVVYNDTRLARQLEESFNQNK